MYKAPTAKEWVAINRVLSHYQVTQSSTDEAQRIVENFLLPGMEDTIIVSNCCGVSLIEETDLCSHCKEHCSEEVHHGQDEEEEYTREDEAYDRASSNAGELI